MTRSSAWMYRERLLSSVVFPEPVPPLMMMLHRACTAADRKSITPWGNAPWRIRSSTVSGLEPNRRMDMAGPSSASGGMMAFTRDPSARRASTMGLVSSTRRPIRPTMRSMICRRWALSRNVTSDRSSLPLRSQKMRSHRLTRMSLIVGSLSSVSSGPRPNVSSITSSISRSWSAPLISPFSDWHSSRIRTLTSLRTCSAGMVRSVWVSSRSTRLWWILALSPLR